MTQQRLLVSSACADYTGLTRRKAARYKTRRTAQIMWIKLMLDEDEIRLIATAFDDEFYREQFDRDEALPDDLIRHYYEIGAQAGKDPSPDFSTKYYLSKYDDVRQYGINPFYHYLKFGIDEGRAPKPTASPPAPEENPASGECLEDHKVDARQYDVIQASFDPDYYESQLSESDGQIGDLVLHYLQSGARTGKDPSKSFSTDYYLSENEDVRLSGMNPFYHFLTYGIHEGRKPKPSSTVLGSSANRLQISSTKTYPPEYDIVRSNMSVDFYLRNNPDLIAAESGGLDLVEHYLYSGWREGRDPHPEFSTVYYLENNADVRSAGVNPFVHFLIAGRKEGRSGRAPRATSLVEIDFQKDAWAQYEIVKKYAREPKGLTRDTQALAFVTTLHGQDEQEAVQSIRLPAIHDDRPPIVSVIIPCFNQGMYALECIASLIKATGKELSFEVIVVDNGSTEEIYDHIAKIANIIYLRNELNEGFGPACNRGAARARGEFLFILNNDAQIAPGCIENLVDAMREHEPIAGIVVPKVLSFNGTLQEAGCIITPSGEGRLVGLNDDHNLSCYNYERWIPYGSAVALLISRADFSELKGFDDIYAPAYYEDVDLGMKLQASGKRVRYVPKALVAHHLSQTTRAMGTKGQQKKMGLVVKNQQNFRTRWQSDLLKSHLRLIAFYLPQYHPIPENNRWWGAGFTEWTNVVKARGNYEGHRQPRRPAELGYYDLRNIETVEHQSRLAKRYGIDGFCYYYYWFAGKRLLEMPIERIIATGRPDHPFCLCWANENWTRTWDGMHQDVLIAQDYTVANDMAIIKDIARYFQLQQYIRIDGKPVLLVYRVKEAPLFARTAETWRNYCRAAGVGEIVIASVESFELSANPEHPSTFGCDFTVEFPPHGMVHDRALELQAVDPDFHGTCHDYRALAQRYMQREEPGWARFRSVLVGWDNTPRRQSKSLVLEHATPGAFQAWLEWTIERTLEMNYGDERLVFINAWNEWCEGSYLEPDAHYGHAYLQAVKNARDALT